MFWLARCSDTKMDKVRKPHVILEKVDEHRRFCCSKCDYVAKKRDNLSYHVKAVHEKGKHYKCVLSGYKTPVRAKLDKQGWGVTALL